MLLDVRLRLLALAGMVTLLAGCGEPPPPPLTAPPGAPGSPASGSPYPLPTGLTAPVPLPTGGVPVTPLPTVPYVPPATLPRTTTTPPRTTTPTPTVSAAAKCRNGPTKAQVLAVLQGQPGIPDRELEVTQGPFCSGTWQFAAVRIADEDADEDEQLFVVTRGQPTALEVIEAGTDVCSVEVRADAPAGIRVRACGS